MTEHPPTPLDVLNPFALSTLLILAQTSKQPHMAITILKLMADGLRQTV